jgi:hypothetical protein
MQSWNEQTQKIEANNHGEIFTASGEVLLLNKKYLEGHDDDEESKKDVASDESQ